MNWSDLKREFEKAIPATKNGEWLFDDIPDRILPYQKNIWYGVRGFVKEGEIYCRPIVVKKFSIIYIDSNYYSLNDINKALRIAEENAVLHFKKTNNIFKS